MKWLHLEKVHIKKITPDSFPKFKKEKYLNCMPRALLCPACPTFHRAFRTLLTWCTQRVLRAFLALEFFLTLIENY